jgi:two-component system, chemotaxis family, protein-glutamate methylesterase/glutaminase
MNDPKFIVVIGTSAGGVTALTELVAQFTPEMDAAFFIVMHLSKTAISDYLIHRLQPVSMLPCQVARDAMPIEQGHIYVAPPNEHLLVNEGQIVVGHGPEENSWRPSINVLFRSAAAAYNSHVVGIILTGYLNDGTSGMAAIKRSGGICIVQDPNEAEFADMPLSVLNNIEVDFSLRLAEFGDRLTEILKRNPKKVEVPADVIAESNIAQRMAIGVSHVENLGTHSIYTCPDCGGVLWQVKDDKINRFRCYTGHSYDENELLATQGHKMEGSMWVAVRMMEERKNLYGKIAQDHLKKGHVRIASAYERQALEIEEHIETLREVLISIEKGRLN